MLYCSFLGVAIIFAWEDSAGRTPLLEDFILKPLRRACFALLLILWHQFIQIVILAYLIGENVWLDKAKISVLFKFKDSKQHIYARREGVNPTLVACVSLWCMPQFSSWKFWIRFGTNGSLYFPPTDINFSPATDALEPVNAFKTYKRKTAVYIAEIHIRLMQS